MDLQDDEKYSKYINVVFHLTSNFLEDGVYTHDFENLPSEWLEAIGIGSGTPKQLMQSRLSVLMGAVFFAEALHRIKANRLEEGLRSYTLYAFSEGWADGHKIQYSAKDLAKLGAAAKLAKDPKQIAKSAVRDCWELWQSNPSRYKGPTAFAKDMREKYENLESVEVICRWCRDWKKTTPPAE